MIQALPVARPVSRERGIRALLKYGVGPGRKLAPRKGGDPAGVYPAPRRKGATPDRRPEPPNFFVPVAALKNMSDRDDIIAAIRRCLRMSIGELRWAIVPDIDPVKAEVRRWQTTVAINLSMPGLNLDFEPQAISQHIYTTGRNALQSLLTEVYQETMPPGFREFATLIERDPRVREFFDKIVGAHETIAESHISQVEHLFERPNPSAESSFRSWLSLVIDDMTLYDAAAVIKNPTEDGQRLGEIYNLPGEQIRLYRMPDLKTPQPPEVAYDWADQAKIKAYYNNDELVYMMCLFGDSQLRLSDGRKFMIREIVEQRIEGSVLTLNAETGELEDKSIVGWHKTPLGDRDWVRVSFRYAKPMAKRLGAKSGTWFTNDHQLLTKSGWKRIDELGQNDVVATAHRAPNGRQQRVFDGTMLGDASLSKRGKNGRAVVELNHCPAQLEWLKLKVAALGCLGFNEPRERQNGSGPIAGEGPPGKQRHIWRSRSRSGPWLQQQYERWYSHGSKVVPHDVALSDEFLVAWYLDDGTLVKSDNLQIKRRDGSRNETVYYSARLSTDGFRRADVDRLAALLTNGGIPAHTVKSRQHFTVYVTARGAKALFERIGRFVPSCMRYKLPPDAPAFDPLVWDLGADEAFWDVPELAYGVPGRESWTPRDAYCIDVADNHNFAVVSGLIAHNCNPQINGYGKSPVAMIIEKMAGSIYANSNMMEDFSNNNLPFFVFDLGPNVSQPDRDAVETAWENRVMKGHYRGIFVGMKEGVKGFMPMPTTPDKTDTTLARLTYWANAKCAVFGLSMNDIGFTEDLHRTTAETQAELTQSRGINSFANIIQGYFNGEIVKGRMWVRDDPENPDSFDGKSMPCFQFSDVKFEFEQSTPTQRLEEATAMLAFVESGSMCINELRKELRLPPIPGGDVYALAASAESFTRVDALDSLPTEIAPPMPEQPMPGEEGQSGEEEEQGAVQGGQQQALAPGQSQGGSVAKSLEAGVESVERLAHALGVRMNGKGH